MKQLQKNRVFNLGVLLLVGLAYFIETQTLGFTLGCPFHRLTGLNCPGCGLGRAAIALLQGKFALAASANWGLTLALPVLVVFGGAALWHWLCAKPFKGRLVTALSAVLLGYFVVWGVLRNVWGL